MKLSKPADYGRLSAVVQQLNSIKLNYSNGKYKPVLLKEIAEFASYLLTNEK